MIDLYIPLFNKYAFKKTMLFLTKCETLSKYEIFSKYLKYTKEPFLSCARWHSSSSQSAYLEINKNTSRTVSGVRSILVQLRQARRSEYPRVACLSMKNIALIAHSERTHPSPTSARLPWDDGRPHPSPNFCLVHQNKFTNILRAGPLSRGYSACQK